MEIGPKEHAIINGNIGIWDRDIVFDDRLGLGFGILACLLFSVQGYYFVCSLL